MPIIPSIALGFLALLLGGGIAAAVKPGDEFAGHPKGLYVLFFAEMWERFSYYGMRALLIFYLTKHWLFDDGKANLIYGAYTSLVFVTPVLGGYLADRYLGQRRAVVYGAVLLTLGHLLMAVEGDGGQASAAINVFWLALGFIIVGSGFLKANISVIVGQLYPLTDIRRDGAYTIFYIGINTGAALGTILAGWLGETYGWSYGFGAAGVGMLLGLLVFVLGKPLLKGQGEAPGTLTRRREWTLYAIGVAAVGVIWLLIQYQDVIETLLMVSGVALLGYVLFASFKLEPHARDRMFAVLFLIALNPLFWGLYEQAGGSLNLYTDRFVDRGGVPASLFQSVNPIYIVLLGPIFASLWVFLGRRGWEPSAPAKFGLALVQVALSFLLFVWGARLYGAALTPVYLVFMIYFFQTSGELCLSPVGLSAMNRLAPRHLASLIMGAWFYMTAVGNFVAGKIGEATGGGEGGTMTRDGTLAVYETIGWWAMGIALLVLLASPLVRRWMHLDTLRDHDEAPAMAGEAELAEPQAAGFDSASATRPN